MLPTTSCCLSQALKKKDILAVRVECGELKKLAKGDHLKLTYGLLIHKGDAKDGNVAGHYSTFSKE